MKTKGSQKTGSLEQFSEAIFLVSATGNIRSSILFRLQKICKTESIGDVVVSLVNHIKIIITL